MKKNMLKVGFNTKKEAGVEQDQSSTPLYLNHIADPYPLPQGYR
jgi:hypothetical protein